MNFIKRYLTKRILRRHAIPYNTWHRVTAKIPLIATRTNKEKARLRLLSTLFLHQKSFTGGNGFEITLDMGITITAQACLEVLYLGLNAFDGWIEIIVYPAAFIVKRNMTDENGIVHPQSSRLSGESWGRGPVILSWQDVEQDSYKLHQGHNVVIHEFAHKLDMLSGRADGQPPLTRDMSLQEWSDTLRDAHAKLVSQIEHHQHSYINSYAATNPAEFFAVSCEYFFTAPHVLEKQCPAVYQQLKSYFKQDLLLNKTIV
jgi:Mlc titration factor MtfA (ptsG expression regulator)